MGEHKEKDVEYEINLKERKIAALKEKSEEIA